MTAHRRSDKPEGHVAFRVCEADGAAQPHMAKRIGAHAVRRYGVGWLLHHAAQAIAHRSQERAVHAVAMFAGEFTQQLRSDQLTGQQRTVEARQPMGRAMTIHARLAITPPSGIVGGFRTNPRIGKGKRGNVLRLIDNHLAQIERVLITDSPFGAIEMCNTMKMLVSHPHVHVQLMGCEMFSAINVQGSRPSTRRISSPIIQP